MFHHRHQLISHICTLFLLFTFIIFTLLHSLLVSATHQQQQQLPTSNNKENPNIKNYPSSSSQRQRTCRYTAELRSVIADLERDAVRAKKDAHSSVEYQQKASEMNPHRAAYSLHHDLKILEHANQQSIKNWNGGFYTYFVTSGQFWKDASIFFHRSVSRYLEKEIDYSLGLSAGSFWTFQFVKTDELIKTMSSSLWLILATLLVRYYLKIETRQKVNFVKVLARERNQKRDQTNDKSAITETRATALTLTKMSKNVSEKINLVLTNSPSFSIPSAKALSTFIMVSGLLLQGLIFVSSLWDHSTWMIGFGALLSVIGAFGIITFVGSFVFWGLALFVFPGVGAMIRDSVVNVVSWVFSFLWSFESGEQHELAKNGNFRLVYEELLKKG